MKTIELLLSLIDRFIFLFLQRKHQNERNDLEESPADWFDDHFSRMPSDKSDKTN